MLSGLALAAVLQLAQAQGYGPPPETGANSLAGSIFQDHILLREGETILVRLDDSGGHLVPRFVAEGDEAREGDPSRNQVRFTFLPRGGPPVLEVENHSADRLSFTTTYRDSLGNQRTPESCPAYRGVTDLKIPPRAVRVEIYDLRWGGHERRGQECG
ncbi:MAG: hypothetical protein WDM92_10170 [Caulobacteraceae bacterium]